MRRRLVIAPLVLKSRVTTHGLSLTFEACDLSKFTAQRVSDSVFMSFVLCRCNPFHWVTMLLTQIDRSKPKALLRIIEGYEGFYHSKQKALLRIVEGYWGFVGRIGLVSLWGSVGPSCAATRNPMCVLKVQTL